MKRHVGKDVYSRRNPEHGIVDRTSLCVGIVLVGSDSGGGKL